MGSAMPGGGESGGQRGVREHSGRPAKTSSGLFWCGEVDFEAAQGAWTHKTRRFERLGSPRAPKSEASGTPEALRDELLASRAPPDPRVVCAGRNRDQKVAHSLHSRLARTLDSIGWAEKKKRVDAQIKVNTRRTDLDQDPYVVVEARWRCHC